MAVPKRSAFSTKGSSFRRRRGVGSRRTATALTGARLRAEPPPQRRVETRKDVDVPDELRALNIGDVRASWELSRLAFGADREPPAGWHDERPGRVGLGIVRDGRLVAKATDREQG